MWSEKCQKGFRWLAVGCLALAAGGIFYEQSCKQARARASSTLQARITKARRTIGEFDAAKTEASGKHGEADWLRNSIPPGAAEVWVPERVKEHFANVGLGVGIIRLTSIHEVPDMPDLRRAYWAVGLPVDEDGRNVTGLLCAAADFERRNPFARVLDFAIRPDVENPSKRVAGLNVMVFIKE